MTDPDIEARARTLNARLSLPGVVRGNSKTLEIEHHMSAAKAEGYREGVKAALAVLNMANMGDTGLAYSIEALLNGVKK